MLKPSEVAIKNAINTTFRASFGRPAPNSFDTRMLKRNNEKVRPSVAYKMLNYNV